MMTKRSQPVLALVPVVGRGILAGRAAGQADYPKIEKAARSTATESGGIVLDLSGLDVLSSSYFDAALWPLWSIIPELYPTLAGVPDLAMDDIEIVLRANNAAAWCFKRSTDRNPGLIGFPLDPALKTTLSRVVELGELTAADLLEVDRSIGATAWSNRLAALHQSRLVRRRKDGRRLIYAPAWKE